MTQFNNELYAGFLPEAGDARFEGKRGFYPAMTAEEYRALPLPMKCATWDARVQYVIFDSYFRDYELSGKVEVHAENAFKALFRHSETDTQLYSVCAVRLFDGTRIAAKWVQDSVSGAFRIVPELLIRASVAILRRAGRAITLLKSRVPRRFNARKGTKESRQRGLVLRDSVKRCSSVAHGE